jgi:ABC-type multidrug transport system fused ATPase/permease subunit
VSLYSISLANLAVLILDYDTLSAREKIGICGRTGSGKSTLGLSFFRFIEASSGRLVIDGIDISTLRLAELRSRLTIVSQESFLFAGSLRFNLDPFQEYDDVDIWDSLVRVKLASPISPGTTPASGPSRAASIIDTGSDITIEEVSNSDKYVVKSLEMELAEGGKNFSAGQRQLVALARGILKLKKTSIVILDESTASLGMIQLQS